MPEDIVELSGKCSACPTLTCTRCKEVVHEGGCDEPNDTDTIRFAESQGWKRCYHCRAYVELNTGCNHIRCRCGAEYCYVCGLKWEAQTCANGCPLWEERRLIEARVEREAPAPVVAPVVALNQVAEVRVVHEAPFIAPPVAVQETAEARAARVQARAAAVAQVAANKAAKNRRKAARRRERDEARRVAAVQAARAQTAQVQHAPVGAPHRGLNQVAGPRVANQQPAHGAAGFVFQDLGQRVRVWAAPGANVVVHRHQPPAGIPADLGCRHAGQWIDSRDNPAMRGPYQCQGCRATYRQYIWECHGCQKRMCWSCIKGLRG